MTVGLHARALHGLGQRLTLSRDDDAHDVAVALVPRVLGREHSSDVEFGLIGGRADVSLEVIVAGVGGKFLDLRAGRERVLGERQDVVDLARVLLGAVRRGDVTDLVVVR